MENIHGFFWSFRLCSLPLCHVHSPSLTESLNVYLSIWFGVRPGDVKGVGKPYEKKTWTSVNVFLFFRNRGLDATACPSQYLKQILQVVSPPHSFPESVAVCPVGSWALKSSFYWYNSPELSCSLLCLWVSSTHRWCPILHFQANFLSGFQSHKCNLPLVPSSAGSTGLSNLTCLWYKWTY